MKHKLSRHWFENSHPLALDAVFIRVSKQRSSSVNDAVEQQEYVRRLGVDCVHVSEAVPWRLPTR